MRFFSDEWIGEASRRLNNDDRFAQFASTARFQLTFVAKQPPPWARDITVIVDTGAVSVQDAAGRPSDAKGHATYATWLALFRHELSPKAAAFRGRLRGRGLSVILRNWKVIDVALDVLREIPIDE